MSRRSRQFSSVRTEGGLLPQDVLSRIQAGDKDLSGLTPVHYHLGPHERIGEAVNRAWSRLTATWHAFQEALAKEPGSSLATGLTRDRWLLPLFEELHYGRLPKGQAIEIEGKSFAVSHTWHHSPIHLLGVGVDLDRRQAGVAGAAKASPHGLVQEFLNRSDDHLWGFVSNGLRLRILRDHHSLTRQAFVEFDLQAIMEGEQYSEFLLLWMVCHQSRVEADKPADCWLETWFNTSREEGVRALDKLRGGVEKAIEAFGTGFLSNRANTRLRDALESGEIDRQEYYRQVLRLVYRLIFLFVAEERDALLNPEADEAARNRYQRFYATRRLRDLAEKKRGGPHGDLWQGLRLVMSKLDDGCPEIALPALGSRLWGPMACPWLMEAECGNHYVLDAVRRISTIEEGRTRYSVSWRNVGADELGSIYEGLLELHPRMNKEAGTFELDTAVGHERKTTGSYYTPTELVECLLESALDPLLDEASRTADPAAAILNLKVCDPACGSGHFLVAAARRISKRLAAVRSGDDEPSPREMQKALRDAVGHCVYGVDLNPMAVELCKVSLWIEAIEPGKPLSFLDHHIQPGNALFGADPELMRDGPPDAAWTALKGEDKKVASRLRKSNQNWRQGSLFDASTMPAGLSALTRMARVAEDAEDDDIKTLRRKAQLWHEFDQGREARHARLVADLWCASFVWPKDSHAAEAAAPVRRVWEVVRANPDALPAATAAVLATLKQRFGFFHWHLSFPTVMGRGGFDLVFGNPPWESLSPNRREFFGQFHENLRALSRADQDVIIDGLLGEAVLAAAWERHQLDLFGLVHFLKVAARFTLYAKGNLGKGDFNVYRMFTELALKYTRQGGYAAQVLPGGLYGGANASAIRQFVFDSCELRLLLGCENKGQKFFPGVHPQTWFALYVARVGGSTGSFKIMFGVEYPEQVAEAAALAQALDADFIRTSNPDTYAIPDMRSLADLTVTRKMLDAHPAFGDATAGFPFREYSAELHMTNDDELFTSDPVGLPVYEGRMISHFDHRAKTYDGGHGNSSRWIERAHTDPEKGIVPQWRVLPEQVPGKLGDRCERYRLAFGDVANPRNVRSLFAALVPPRVICGNTVPTVTFEVDWEWAYLPWLAVANSFVMDWFTRKKLSSPHLNFHIVDTLPFPRPKLTDPWVQRAVPLVLRLVCTAPEMTPFWNRMAAYGLCQAVPEGTIPAGALLDEAARALARAELDALVAREVYGLTRGELADVLETFPVVKKRDIKAFGEYRTKRLILGAFDELAARRPPLAALDVAAMPTTVPTLDPGQEAAICLWALVHANGGSIPRIELARAFALRSQPDLLARLARTDLIATAGTWAQRVARRSVGSGVLLNAIRTLADRDGIRLTTGRASESVVTTSPNTPPEDQIDPWFRFEARLALGVLAALSPADVQGVDASMSDADRVLIQVGGA